MKNSEIQAKTERKTRNTQPANRKCCGRKWPFRSAPCFKYFRDEIIYSPKDASNLIYYIHTGKVKLSHLDESGKCLTVMILEAGEIFGEGALFGRDTRDFLAEAFEDACVSFLPSGDLWREMRNNPHLACWVLHNCGQHGRQIIQKLTCLPFRSLYQRTARELYELATRFGERCECGVMIHITHQELADLTGSARETTTVIVKQLRQAGLIASYQRMRCLVIKDLAALQHIALSVLSNHTNPLQNARACAPGAQKPRATPTLPRFSKPGKKRR